eukprot:Hpha_TRINITY_DN27430_c0_g1::TRINITY_DN27430_c0_g1_i1::g.193791::m.193791
MPKASGSGGRLEGDSQMEGDSPPSPVDIPRVPPPIRKLSLSELDAGGRRSPRQRTTSFLDHPTLMGSPSASAQRPPEAWRPYSQHTVPTLESSGKLGQGALGGSPLASPPRRFGGSGAWTRMYSQHTMASHGAMSVRSTVVRGGDIYMGDDAATTVAGGDHRASLGTSLVRGPETDAPASALYWVQVVVSFALLSFCVAFTISAMLQEGTSWWEGPPVAVNIALFPVLLFLLALLEGSQVPLISLARGSQAEVAQLDGTHPRAYKACRLCHGEGMLERYLLGREFLKLVVYFLLAKLTKSNGTTSPLSLPGFFADLGKTGLIASIPVVLLGQLITQMAAAREPIAFLSFPLVLPLAVWPSLAVERTGIVHAAYLLKAMFGGGGVKWTAGEVIRCVVSVAGWLFGSAIVFYLLWEGW